MSGSRTSSGRPSRPSVRLQNVDSTGNNIFVSGKKRERDELSEKEEVTNTKIVLPKDKKI